MDQSGAFVNINRTKITVATKSAVIYIAAMENPTDPPTRKTMTLPESVWRRISRFRFSSEIKSETEAVRLIVDAGLDVLAPVPVKKPKRAKDVT